MAHPTAHATARPTASFDRLAVSVTITSLTNRGRCFDGWVGPLGCTKPDFFVTMSGSTASAVAPDCTTSVVTDIDNVSPAPATWTCSLAALRPGQLTIAVWDSDGAASDQADASPGDPKSIVVNLEFMATGQAVTLTRTGDDVTISFTVSATVVRGTLGPVTLSAPSFDPTIGEAIFIRGSALQGAQLTFVARRGGAQVWTVGRGVTPAAPNYEQIWQGKDVNGNSLPPGSYDIEVSGKDPHSNSANVTSDPVSRSVTVQIRAPAPPVTLQVVRSAPYPRWSPSGGPFEVHVGLGGPATLSWTVRRDGGCGPGTTVVASGAVTPRSQGATTVTWSGQTGAAVIAPGVYSLELVAVFAGNLTRNACVRDIQVIAAPTLWVAVTYAPLLPRPGSTVEITTRAVDSLGNDRRTDSLEVWGIAFSTGPPFTAAAAPLAACRFTHRCTAVLTIPAAFSRIWFQGRAFDRPAPTRSTGWRVAEIFPPQSEMTWPNPIAIHSGAVTATPSNVGNRTREQSLDVVFRPSTEYDLTDPLSRAQFGEEVATIIDELLGIYGRRRHTSSLLRTQEVLKIYVAPVPSEVTLKVSDSLCSYRAVLPRVDWANAQGVLHRQRCRDNANRAEKVYSAQAGASEVIYHELHHALFGLADEYCCDGGYGVVTPLSNVTASSSECTLIPGRPPTGCQQIARLAAGVLQVPVPPRWRVDPEPSDVMINNFDERWADERRAVWVYQQCETDQC